MMCEMDWTGDWNCPEPGDEVEWNDGWDGKQGSSCRSSLEDSKRLAELGPIPGVIGVDISIDNNFIEMVGHPLDPGYPEPFKRPGMQEIEIFLDTIKELVSLSLVGKKLDISTFLTNCSGSVMICSVATNQVKLLPLSQITIPHDGATLTLGATNEPDHTCSITRSHLLETGTEPDTTRDEGIVVNAGSGVHEVHRRDSRSVFTHVDHRGKRKSVLT